MENYFQRTTACANRVFNTNNKYRGRGAKRTRREIKKSGGVRREGKEKQIDEGSENNDAKQKGISLYIYIYK